MKELRMFPYQIHLLQQLLPECIPCRLNYGKYSQVVVRNEFGCFNRLLLFNKCGFLKKGVVNKHSCRISSAENLHTVVEVPHTSQKCMLWCCIHSTKITGRYRVSEYSIHPRNDSSRLFHSQSTARSCICIYSTR